jgi:hypothetical protein
LRWHEIDINKLHNGRQIILELKIW